MRKTRGLLAGLALLAMAGTAQADVSNFTISDLPRHRAIRHGHETVLGAVTFTSPLVCRPN